MNQQFYAQYVTTTKTLCLACGLAMLSACGGGTNSTSVDPTIAQSPIAYVKRPVPTNDGTPTGTPISSDIRDPETIHPGAHLMVKMNGTVDSPEIDITDAIIGDTGDVRDPSFSPDGTKLLFALHKAEDNNANPPITWDIYEYDLTKPLSQTSGSENPWRVMTFGASDGDDIQPSFMPGNRILFTSTRATQTQAIQRDQGFSGGFSPTVEESKSNKHAFNIFSMDDSGSSFSVQQLSYNMSDDFYPSIIRNIPGLKGRILFTRWEHTPGRNQMSLYTMNPDGTDVRILYGEHSHNTGTNNTGTNNNTIQFMQPRETSSGQVIALAMPFTNTTNGTFDGGDPVLINVNQYTDNNILVSGSNSTGGQMSLSGNTASTVPGISKGGRYSSVFPMLDGTNRALVSYSVCFVNVVDNSISTPTTQVKSCNDSSITSAMTVTEAPPRYGIFAFDIGEQTMLPITSPQPGVYFTDVAAAMNIGDAPYLPDTTTAGDTGILNIRSVYDMDGSFSKLGSTDSKLLNTNNGVLQLADPAQSTADPANNPGLIQRPAMFLRIVKGVYLPDRTVDYKASDFGVSRARLMREIIGYAPIDPDGSVRVQVPANVPLSFDVLDRTGKRIEFNNGNVVMEHRNWLTVRPGEELKCNGCHDRRSTAPHGRSATQPASIYPGATAAEVAVNKFTNSIIAPTQIGQTMAEARTDSGGQFSLLLSMDINFSDVWTDMSTTADQTARPNNEDASFYYKYEYLPTGDVAPVDSLCIPPNGAWKTNCRVVINYETNIEPMLKMTGRTVTDALGNPIMVGGVVDTTDVSCANCHNSNDPTNQAQASADYLDFSGAATQQNQDWLSNYSQLLQPHDEIAADGSNVTDGAGNNIQNTPPIVAGSAARSSFFNEFTPGVTATKTMPHCTVDDSGVCQPWLNVDELKLMEEWVDEGAQYYNNPFAVGAHN